MTPKQTKTNSDYEKHIEVVMHALEEMTRAELEMKAATHDYYHAKQKYENLCYISRMMDFDLNAKKEEE